MAPNIIAKLPPRMLSTRNASIFKVSRQIERGTCILLHQARSRSITATSKRSAARNGAPRPTRQDPVRHRRGIQHDGHTGVGQIDGDPAKFIMVNIDGGPKVFDAAYLRDSCTCPQCRDPYSKQKLFQTSDIPADIKGSGKLIESKEAGAFVELEWRNDVKEFGMEHRTRHSVDWLRRALHTEAELRSGARHDERVLWNQGKIAKDNKWIDYNTYMLQDEVLFEALTHLDRYGLLFVKNVPDSEESVIKIASRIGNLKDTFYGRTWDVRSKPRAENIAYTPVFLGLHMDLLYTSNPPHLQLLHSLRARTPGGESFFSDSLHAAHQLHQSSPSQFNTLCTFPVTYQYHHPEHHYHFNRSIIELFSPSDHKGRTMPAIKCVNWSPPFQGSFEACIGADDQSSLHSFVAASHEYEQILSAEENVYEYRLKEGECVIFDNRRVLHARKAFDATKGERWLKGAYIDDDVFFSRLRVLQEKFKGYWVSEGVVRRSSQ